MLRRLEAFEINQVLKSNFKIWSPGLDRTVYKHYQWWQFESDWGRRNLKYFGYFEAGSKVLASCKLYRFEYVSAGRVYKIAGIGAVFVPEEERGKSYGLKMLAGMAELANDAGYDALFLNSDIDPDYYRRLGYKLFDASGWAVKLSDDWLRSAQKELEALCDKNFDESFNIRALRDSDFDEMCKHHRRWLARMRFGLRREEDYWRFKLGRESFLYRHSALNWPKLDIISDNFGKFHGGYALIEQSGSFLRVLEVIGPERVQASLYCQILRLAKRRNISTLRGWKVVAPPVKGLKFHARTWSFPMICPLKSELAPLISAWTESEPPTMLELDHI